MPTTSTYLEPGKQLTITADSGSSGTLQRLANQPGGGSPLASVTVSASTRVAVGPYSVTTRWEIISANGELAYSIANPATEADQMAGGIIGTAGVAAGSGVTATEYGDGIVHKTVLTISGLVVTMTDAGAAGSHGTQKLYDFPAGPIQLLGASYNLTTLAGAGGIGDTGALVGSLGSVALATDNATLTSTEADMIASTSGTLSSGAGTLKKHGSLVATAFDGTTTPVDAILNLAVPDAGSSADDTVTVSGTVTLVWLSSGDY